MSDRATETDLWTRLHNWGTADWIRRKQPEEAIAISNDCIAALDRLQEQTRKIERLRDGLQLIADGTYNEKGAESWAKFVLETTS